MKDQAIRNTICEAEWYAIQAEARGDQETAALFRKVMVTLEAVLVAKKRARAAMRAAGMSLVSSGSRPLMSKQTRDRWRVLV